ncbi:hypothetical protein TIFTF001_049347 [Ficus carica]|uniref:Uncharacterized protein n=1 Tax=Ficus carica TaxID=3494 RepID=A0AA87Z0J8_FICCA|nr:hypothetical protein TIFTF001_049347 [Ficus carica]
MMFRKGLIKEFDPLRLPDSMRKSFEDYKNSVPKPPFTSGLGITRVWDFFDQILTEQFWLLSDHIEEAMYGIRKKQSKYRDVINQDVVILDDIFSQLLVMNANEDGIIYDALMTYVKGDTPKMGKCWNAAPERPASTPLAQRARAQRPHVQLARPSGPATSEPPPCHRVPSQRARSIPCFQDRPDWSRSGRSGKPASTCVFASLDRFFWTGLTGPVRSFRSGKPASACVLGSPNREFRTEFSGPA